MTTLPAPTAPPVRPRPAPKRRRPVGAEVLDPESTHFRVWAPRSRAVEVVLEPSGQSFSLSGEVNGYHSALLPVKAGALYRYRLDAADQLLPDPASRFQPDGPFGPS